MFGCGFTAELIEVHCACGSGVLFEEELYPSFDMTGVGFCGGSPTCRVAIVQFELARLAQEAQKMGQVAAGMAAVVGRLLANCDAIATANAVTTSSVLDGGRALGEAPPTGDEGEAAVFGRSVKRLAGSCGTNCSDAVLGALGDHDAFCGARMHMFAMGMVAHL